MSRDASIDLDWADGTHRFRLAISQLRELQEKTGQGPQRLLERLASGDWRVDDAPTIIRLGLIGGGMKPLDALQKVRTYVEDRPAAENVRHALAVLMAGLYGAPDEPLGKEAAPAAAPEMTGLNSPPFTEMAS